MLWVVFGVVSFFVCCVIWNRFFFWLFVFRVVVCGVVFVFGGMVGCGDSVDGVCVW